MMPGSSELSYFQQGFVRMFARNSQDRFAGSRGIPVDEIHDRSLMFAGDSCVRFGNEIPDLRRVPVIAPRSAAALVHSLLNDGPLPRGAQDEGMEIDLE